MSRKEENNPKFGIPSRRDREQYSKKCWLPNAKTSNTKIHRRLLKFTKYTPNFKTHKA